MNSFMYERSVSVIIPTYNRAALLKHALDSVMAQTYPVHEIIVVDDGSTDETRDMVWRYLKESSLSIVYIHQYNQGQAAARNRGIESATGEWIAFLDSDDTWLPKKLELQFEALRIYGQCRGCFTDGQFMDAPTMPETVFKLSGVHDRLPFRQDVGYGLVPFPFRLVVQEHVPIWIQTLIVRSDLARRIGGFDTQLHFGEDADFTFRLALATDLCFVNAPLTRIDRGPTPRLTTLWDQGDLLRWDQRRFEKWLKSEGLPDWVRDTILLRLSETHSAWANWYLWKEDYRSARQSMTRAMKYGWSYARAIKWILTQLSPQFARKVTLKRAMR